jgi:hypothetical protein
MQTLETFSIENQPDDEDAADSRQPFSRKRGATFGAVDGLIIRRTRAWRNFGAGDGCWRRLIDLRHGLDSSPGGGQSFGRTRRIL